MFLSFITALKCLTVLKASLTVSHVALSEVRAIGRNFMMQEQEAKGTRDNGPGGYSPKS